MKTLALETIATEESNLVRIESLIAAHHAAYSVMSDLEDAVKNDLTREMLRTHAKAVCELKKERFQVRTNIKQLKAVD